MRTHAIKPTRERMTRGNVQAVPTPQAGVMLHIDQDVTYFDALYGKGLMSEIDHVTCRQIRELYEATGLRPAECSQYGERLPKGEKDIDEQTAEDRYHALGRWVTSGAGPNAWKAIRIVVIDDQHDSAIAWLSIGLEKARGFLG